MSENMINTAALIEKRKLFFERPENSYENFFDLVKDSKKSGMCNLWNSSFGLLSPANEVTGR